MTDNSTQVFPEYEAIQESSYAAYEQLEDISPSLVIVSDCSKQSYDEDQCVNESAFVENASVTWI